VGSSLVESISKKCNTMSPSMVLPRRAISVFLVILQSRHCAAITAEMQATLDKHNVYRCMHEIPAFTWDAAIAANAQAHADKGVYEHSASADRVANGVQCGENIAWGYPTYSGTASTVAWYSEIEFTQPYGTADSMSDSVPANEVIGHYTQVVWKASIKLGCGKGTATVNGKSGDYWVCQYGPAGNFGGQFTTNVLAPSKTVTSCGGTSADTPNNGNGLTGGTPAPTPAPPSNSCHTAPADKSRKECETCFHGDQCPDGYYCCPYMKKCVASSSMGCSLPIASCTPMCYDSQCNKAAGCDCSQCNTQSKSDWLAWANLQDSNSGSPSPAPCPVPGPKKGSASGAASDGMHAGLTGMLVMLLSGLRADHTYF